MGVLGIDRDALWHELFTLEPRAAADANGAAQGSATADTHLTLLHRARTAGQLEPLRAMLTQRIGYWLRSDVVPAFWRFFDGYDALLQRSVRAKRERHAFSLFCAEQLTLALQFADEAFAHCIELASLFDGACVDRRSPYIAVSTHCSHPHECVAPDDPYTTQRASMRDELTTHFRCLVFEDAAHKEVRSPCGRSCSASQSLALDRLARSYLALPRRPRALLLHELPPVPRCVGAPMSIASHSHRPTDWMTH